MFSLRSNYTAYLPPPQVYKNNLQFSLKIHWILYFKYYVLFFKSATFQSYQWFLYIVCLCNFSWLFSVSSCTYRRHDTDRPVGFKLSFDVRRKRPYPRRPEDDSLLLYVDDASVSHYRYYRPYYRPAWAAVGRLLAPWPPMTWDDVAPHGPRRSTNRLLPLIPCMNRWYCRRWNHSLAPWRQSNMCHGFHLWRFQVLCVEIVISFLKRRGLTLLRFWVLCVEIVTSFWRATVTQQIILKPNTWHHVGHVLKMELL